MRCVTGESLSDQDRIYADVAERQPDAAVVVPSRATVTSKASPSTDPGRCRSGQGAPCVPGLRPPSAGESRWSATVCAHAETSARGRRSLSLSMRSTAYWTLDT